jgi:predicted O-methyltransferase YrrM
MGILKRILGPQSNPLCDKPDTFNAMARRLEFLKSGTNKRFWWHQMQGHDYLPPVYSFLDDLEWRIMESWFEDTEKNLYIGECNVPMMSMLQGLIMGSAIDSIVECGHFAGYSTLLIGFMLRKMGKQHGLFTIDINETISKYTQGWIDKAGLHDYVLVVEGDSMDPKMPDLARKALSSEIKLVFIDSSHEYANTLKELDLWYEAIASQGLVILHDTSSVSANLDPTEEGGVKRGFCEWIAKHSSASININEDPFPDGTPTIPVYKDVCGLGIIQKAGPPAIEAKNGA